MIDLIKYLQDRGVLDFINAFTTVVLALFALVQLRQNERQRDDQLRTAYGALWVEYWRLWTVSDNWTKSDLIQLEQVGLYRPEEILPQDWGALLPLLGQLGTQTARFGGTAYAHAALAATTGLYLQRILAEREERLENLKDAEKAQEVFTEFKEPLQSAQTKARRLAAESAVLFEDALKSAPKWLQDEKVNFEGLDSDFARRLALQVTPQRSGIRGLFYRIWRRMTSSGRTQETKGE